LLPMEGERRAAEKGTEELFFLHKGRRAGKKEGPVLRRHEEKSV